jgi:hypothetical protein
LFATVIGEISFANLTPASGRQDHTTSPSANRALVRCAAHVHRIPCPTSVTIAKRPSVWDGMARDMQVICVRREWKYFERRTRHANHFFLSFFVMAGLSTFVIPGRERSERARNPYSLQGLWIPGLRQVAIPE